MVKALLLLYAVWGFNWVVMKEATLFFPSLTFSSFRFASAAVVLLLVNAWLRLPIPPRPYWKWIALTGVLQIGFNLGAVQVSIQYLDAGLVAVLNYSMPVWMAILAYFFLNEPLTKRKIGGIAACMIGMCILMNIQGGGNFVAILLALSGAIAWAIAGVIIKIQNEKHVGQGCNMIQYTTWQMVAGAISVCIYSLIFETGTITWNAMSVACLAYNGVLASALAFFLWNYILTHMEAGKASVVVLGVPVVGVLCGILFLGEQPDWHTALGMVLIFAGILLIVTQANAIRKKVKA